MEKIIKPKKYDFSNVIGISEYQLKEHYKLYKGYVNKVNELLTLSNDSQDFKNSNPTYSKMRSVKLGESYALNGVKLHQLYFNNITSTPSAPKGLILKKIVTDFESLENFIEYFKEVGSSVRGWAILCIDPIDNKLHIYGSDTHDTGAMWLCYPLLIMDVYEHAYFIDFGTNKKAYMDEFFKNVNWNKVNLRLKKYFNLLQNNLFERQQEYLSFSNSFINF
ncbi:superoxide dismutase [Clostridium oceanicum]|uniref:superoxide dismutase n=1 Tax=Clostridium oceanicum TaxID=1543 RepID=A0ABN1JGQ6_9CLOT